MLLTILLFIIAMIAFSVLVSAKHKSLAFKLSFFAISFVACFMGVLNFLLVFNLTI